MACRKIKNKKNNIKSPARLNIVSCPSAQFNSKTSNDYQDTSNDGNPTSQFDTL